MNVMCVTLPSRAVSRAIQSDMKREGKQLLPREDEITFVNSINLTRDLAKTVQYEVGKENAREYLISQ